MADSGVTAAAFEDDTACEVQPGDLCYFPPEPHDSWVMGDQPYVSLHFMGASEYAKK